MDLVMQILQWLIPTGGILTLFGWIRQRDTRKERVAKEKNDIYKEMYDNISGTLLELQNENKRLYKAVRQLNQTIQKATACPHYGECPMRDELQKLERIDAEQPVRQPAKRKKIRADPAADSPEFYQNDGSDFGTGGTARGHGL